MPERFSDSYLTMFTSSAMAYGREGEAFGLLFLFLGRILPIIALAPFFGARVLPNPVKVFMGIGLFVIFLPHLLLVTKKVVPFDTSMIILMLKEMVVGFILGFMISILFMFVQAAGMIVDHQRGGASLMVNDPTIQNQSSPLGLLFNQVTIVLFFMIDGPFLFIEALIKSYDMIPPDQFFNPAFFAKDSPFWNQQIQLFNQVMIISLQLCTPAILAILMTDVFLGIANRLAPQVQISFLGMPLKSLLGLAVICLGWTVFSTEIVRQAHHWLNVTMDTIKYMKTG